MDIEKTAVRESALPYFASGEVVTGFGRGSKEIGVPTGASEHLQRYSACMHMYYCVTSSLHKSVH